MYGTLQPLPLTSRRRSGAARPSPSVATIPVPIRLEIAARHDSAQTHAGRGSDSPTQSLAVFGDMGAGVEVLVRRATIQNCAAAQKPHIARGSSARRSDSAPKRDANASLTRPTS